MRKSVPEETLKSGRRPPPGPAEATAGRLDRQLRIPGWNQRALEEGKIAVVGDADLLASLYLLSAAALGLRRLFVLAPRLDAPLRAVAAEVEPALDLCFLEGFYAHPVVGDVLAGCDLIVDLSRYGLANKLLLDKGFREGVPVIRGFCRERNGEEELRVFTYLRGREWDGLRDLVAETNLPRDHFDDGVLDIIAAGIALEETANVLMGRGTSEEIITYGRPALKAKRAELAIGVVGAGALGNFVGLGLVYAGFRNVAFLDPDDVDVTNLNRQVFLAGRVGSNKAEALAGALNSLFGTRYRGQGAHVGRGTDLSGYDVVFDCADDFETKIALSETCRDRGKILVSGGTGAAGGQVVVYDPGRPAATPAEVLELDEIVRERGVAGAGGEGAACARAPEPSVIMTNQIIGGLMVDSLRVILEGREAPNLFYDSSSDKRL